MVFEAGMGAGRKNNLSHDEHVSCVLVKERVGWTGRMDDVLWRENLLPHYTQIQGEFKLTVGTKAFFTDARR